MELPQEAVEIDLIHKGIKTRGRARSCPRFAAVEIDLIHKGIKTGPDENLSSRHAGEGRNRPDS